MSEPLKFPGSTFDEAPELHAQMAEIDRLVAEIRKRTAPQDIIFDAIRSRRLEQDQKFGTQDHDWYFWNTILGEEFGEVCKASLEKDRPNWRGELIDLAAVCVAALEQCERLDSAEATLRRTLRGEDAA